MKRAKLCTLMLFALLGACRSEEGAVLQILSSPAFADDCTVPATPTLYQSVGLYDPTGSDGFALTLFLRNQANTVENPAAIPGDPNVKPNANDALIIGYDYCFYDGDDPDVTAYDPKGEGLLVDCDDLPDAQRGFVASAATVEAGEGTLSTLVRVLDHGAMQALWGAAFDPFTLANPAQFGDPTNQATRNGAWGTFPAAFEATVIVNVRARAKRQDGGTIRSNWFGYPVRVAPGAVTLFSCQATAVTCPDGSSGLQGSRLGDVCSAAFSGGPVACEDLDTCS